MSRGSKRHVVGLFHGVRTGHLMIYCNSKIIQVDFNVRDSTSYSFFIDEELCEVSIEKRDGRFFYDFKINKEADTPLNRKRKKTVSHNKRILIAFFVGLAIFLSIGLLFGYSQKKKREREKKENLSFLLKNLEVETIGTIQNVSFDEETVRIVFNYDDEGEIKEAQNEFSKTDLLPKNRWFPLQEGDEFSVKYHINRDDALLILNQITEVQMSKYFQLALAKESTLHPELPKEELLCRVKCAYQVKGLVGLADFYFQDATVEQHPLSNELSYKRLVRDIPFQKEIEQNCLVFSKH